MSPIWGSHLTVRRRVEGSFTIWLSAPRGAKN
jgi:hypothetical protein